MKIKGTIYTHKSMTELSTQLSEKVERLEDELAQLGEISRLLLNKLNKKTTWEKIKGWFK